MSGARQAVGALVLAALVGATLAPSAVAEDGGKDEAKAVKAAESAEVQAISRPPRPHAPSADEEKAHGTFIEGITDPIWKS